MSNLLPSVFGYNTLTLIIAHSSLSLEPYGRVDGIRHHVRTRRQLPEETAGDPYPMSSECRAIDPEEERGASRVACALNLYATWPETLLRWHRGTTASAAGEWIAQQARNLAWKPQDGALRAKFLLRDR